MVHSDCFCTGVRVVVVVAAAAATVVVVVVAVAIVVVVAGVVVVVAATVVAVVVVVAGVVVVVVVGAATIVVVIGVSHVGVAGTTADTPTRSMGTTANRDTRFTDARTAYVTNTPVAIAIRATRSRLVEPPVEGNLQTSVANTKSFQSHDNRH